MKPLEMALAWAVIHSLWQSSFIAAALGLVLCAARSPRVRYAASCAALLAAATAFALTFLYFLPEHHAVVSPATYAAPVPVATFTGSARPELNPWDLHAALPWISALWLAGVCIFSIRNVVSYLAARRMRTRGVCPAPQFWQDRLDALRLRFHIRRTVTILESCVAGIPAVVGHLRPVILMPLGLLAGMPVEQIESILIHELAHIRRFDFTVNIIQAFVESLLFYHPAVWWISRTVRAEREQCCDDFVVNSTGDARTYASALTALEENRSRFADLAIAATGGTLVNRILRLIDPSRRRKVPAASALALVATALLICTGAAAVAWPIHSTPSAPKTAITGTAESSPTTATAVPAPAPAPRWTAKPIQARPVPGPVAGALALWLNEDVTYIITPEERAQFEALQSDAERERFIEQFWQRRDPTPGTPKNEYRDEHYRRIAYTNEHYGTSTIAGWRTDRGRAYIMWGAPDEIETHPDNYTRANGERVPYPIEFWHYRYIEGTGQNVVLEFIDPLRNGEFRQTASPIDAPAPKEGHLEGAARLEELERQDAELAVAFRPDYPLRRRIESQIADLQKVSFQEQQPVSISMMGVSVLGAVKVPGVYVVQGQKSLLDVLAMAQGLAANAGKTIQIVRHKTGEGNTTETLTISVEDLFQNGKAELNIPIRPNDVINVLRAYGSVYVVGAVNKPGEYALSNEKPVTVSQAIALANGFAEDANKAAVEIVRTHADGAHESINADLRLILRGLTADVRLSPNDIVFVPAINRR